MMKKTLLGALLGCALAMGFGSVSAQSASAATARIIVGNQPGGSTDTVARLLAPLLSDSLNRNFVVENRVGASGNIAADHVAKATPDGNTILLIFNAHTTVGPLFPDLPFDPIEDFAPIATINKALNDALNQPETIAKLESIGMNPIGGTPEQLGEVMINEQTTWTTLIKESGITVN